MKDKIDNKKGKTKYIKIYEKIKNDIVNGVYKKGEKLPSKRITAQENGVSVISVEHAYGLLCDEGYIESRERSGFFVVFSKSYGFMKGESVEIEKISEQVEQSNLPPFPFSVLTKTMRRVINDYGENIMQKTTSTGCAELRTALAMYLARNRGIYVEPSQIVVGSGAEYLYALIVGILGKDKTYGIENPSYEKIEKVYKMQGVKCKLLSLGAHGIKSGELKNTSADILHVSPYRSFPTGITTNASKRHEYIAWTNQKKGRYIIEDDFESEFSISSKPEETLFALSKDNVIYMNSFSLTVSPAFRVGYMVLPKNLVEVFNEKLGFYSCSVPTFEQLVLTQLISNGDFERHINSVRRHKRNSMKK